MQFLILLGLMALFVVTFLMGEQIGLREGYQKGYKTALSTSPISEDLEMVCVGLWVGEQNRQYIEKKK